MARINFEITDGIYTLSDSLEENDYADVEAEKQRRFNDYVAFIKNPPPPSLIETE